MQDQIIRIREKDAILDIPFSACILYHGYDSIGGLALGFRLMSFALDKLSEGKIPNRTDIIVRTAFPGPGFSDAVEMVTRARSRGALEVLLSEDVDGPEGVYGKMYFEIVLGDQILKVALKDGAIPRSFIDVGRSVKAGNNDPETLAEWTRLKQELAKAVWSAQPDDLFVIRG